MDPLIVLREPELRALQSQRLLTLRDDAVFRLEGPGVTDCLQGLLTNDVKAGGDHGLVWGAVLTPKGMIISDAWVLRDGATAAWVLVPAAARETVRALFQKTLPPRLAKCTDRSGEVQVAWFLGSVPAGESAGGIAIPHGPAPFGALLVSATISADVARWVAMGWHEVDWRFGEASKLRLGWPTLGREIDEKTLVQEVRFDQLAGVRYDKGCYTGQETVARLHFRGHPNRQLVGITWPEGTGPTATDVMAGDKVVGSLGTVGRLGSRVMALCVMRREVAIGSTVTTGATTGTVVDLPFDLAEPLVA